MAVAARSRNRQYTLAATVGRSVSGVVMSRVFGYIIEDDRTVIAHNESHDSMESALGRVEGWLPQLGPTFGTVRITIGEVNQDTDNEVNIVGYSKK